ncbi:hypothetical protein E3J49_08425 [Candidatus Bathyarchaeota archaeon]|nr:MAG: hypothetical protein E3J49_08425 [Candidatus Bathyarchaeota archaeon]
MLKKLVSEVMLTTLLIGMVTLTFNIKPVKASGTIYIRADGSVDPLTAPISSADNITYVFTDNIFNKTIEVQRKNTIIDGNGHLLQGTGTGRGFYLNAHGVTVKSTRIIGFGYGVYWSGGWRQKIINNSISCTFTGIYINTDLLWGDSIIGNRIFGNRIAIHMDSMASEVDVINNTIRYNDIVGIWLDNWCGCWGGRIVGNLISNNGAGIRLRWVICFLRDNTLVNNGLEVGGWYPECYEQDIDSSNTINGKPIYYWMNQQDKTVPLDAAYVALVNCKNIIVENLTLTGSGGVIVVSTTDSTIRNLSISNDYYGFTLLDSERNRIYGNNITDCWIPIIGGDNAENIIYHNNFINNGEPPRIYESEDSWDMGYPFGGNYWSDYNGTDLYCDANQSFNGSDGIGDTQYVFPDAWSETNFTDRYPLIEPWTPSWEPIPPFLTGDVNYDRKVNIYDITFLASIYRCKEGDLEWNPFADLAQPYGQIDIFDLVTCAAHYGETYP